MIPAHHAPQPPSPTIIEHPTPTPNIDFTSQLVASLSLTTAAAMKSPPTFLGVARETREQIYKYLLVVDTYVYCGVLVVAQPEYANGLRKINSKGYIDTQIMFANKQIFLESSDVLYKMNAIEIRVPEFADRFYALKHAVNITLVIPELDSDMLTWRREISAAFKALAQNTI